jgi:hypothetical protein
MRTLRKGVTVGCELHKVTEISASGEQENTEHLPEEKKQLEETPPGNLPH